MMEEEITNRVENSGLVQVNLDEFYPRGERVRVDLKEFLHEEAILIEKAFRTQVKETDWSIYKNKWVSVSCSVDAIVPLWAYMLLVVHLKPHCNLVVMGSPADLEKAIFSEVIKTHDFNQYQDKNVIVKGCGKHPIPESVFVDFTNELQQYAKNIMFGEACSAVPLYKRMK